MLSGAPARSPEAVVERLLAVQAQDVRGARLTVRSRTNGLRASDVDDALERGFMVITWLNRGTLHLVRAADYWWLHAVTTPQLATTNRRRLRQEGVSAAQAERGIEVVTDAVLSGGPQTRAQLRRRLDAAGVPTAEQAFTHVLFAASIRGLVVRGPMRGSEHAFVAVSEWLGAPAESLERNDALARLARRYLAGHAPADARDLARWARIDTRRCARRTRRNRRGAGRRDRWARRSRATGSNPRPCRSRVCSVPSIRSCSDGSSRELFVGVHKGIVTNNGLFRPFALVDGRAVAVWWLSGTTLTVKLMEDVKPAVIKALRNDAADLLRFLDRPQETDVVFET